MPTPRRRAVRLIGSVVVPLALIAVILTADALEGPKTAYVGLLAVTPMLSAVFGRPVVVVGVGAAAVLAAWLFGLQSDDGQVTAQVVRLAAIGIMTAIAAVAAEARRRSEQALDRADRIVTAVTQAVIRPLPGEVGTVELAARYTGAEAAAHVGGDFYEVLSTPFGVRVVLGDVRGKGLAAVRLANYVLGAFREAARRETDLQQVVRAMDDLVAAEGDAEDFVTAVVVEVVDGRLRGVSCGHPPPVVVGRDTAWLARTMPGDLPLGLGAGRVPVGVVRDDGRRFLLYSDGLTEARDRRGEFLDLEATVTGLVDLPAPALVDAVQRAVVHHATGRLRDDVALLCVTLPAGPHSPAPDGTASLAR